VDVTRIERVLLGVGAVAIAVLAVLAYQSWVEYSRDEPVAIPSEPTLVETTRTATPTTMPAPLRPPERPPILELTAARAPSWMTVRRETPNGRVLFEGVLPQGRTITFRETRVWVRFGSAENVDAELGDRRLRIGKGIVEGFVGENGFER